MKAGIHIVSCMKDKDWLDYCLAGVMKFCHGYHDVVVSTDWPNNFTLQPICDKYKVRLHLLGRYELVAGQLVQQIPKMQADLICKDCDFVVYVDSDSIFIKDNTPETWTENGKPVLCSAPWVDCGPAACWQASTINALHFDTGHETMRQLPLIYPVSVIKSCREHVEHEHGMTIEEFISHCDKTNFSEFNVLGSYALKHCADQFTLKDFRVTDRLWGDYLRQFWSWAGVTEQVKEELNAYLK